MSFFSKRFGKEKAAPAEKSRPAPAVSAQPTLVEVAKSTPAKVEITAEPREIAQERKKIIAVMGPTGAGKSSLIRGITGDEDIRIGHGMNSETTEIATYEVNCGNEVFLLADTPGFDDTFESDLDILRRLAAWLDKDSSHAMVGIIYLYPIHDARLRGSSTKGMALLERLCGNDCFKRVMLVTTFWDVINRADAQRRETELGMLDSPWKTMKDGGASVERIGGERDYPRFRTLLQRMAQKSVVELTLQKEMGEGKSIEQTKVAQVLIKDSEEHMKRVEQLQNDFQTKISIRQAEAEAQREAHTSRLNALHGNVAEQTARERAAVAERLEAQQREHAEEQSRTISELQRRRQTAQAKFARFEQFNAQAKKAQYISRLEERAQIRMKASLHQQDEVDSQLDMIRMAHERGMIRGLKIEGIDAKGVGRSLYDDEENRIDSSVDTTPLNGWCDACRFCIGAQEFAACVQCSTDSEDFIICSRCQLRGRGCLDRKHELYRLNLFMADSLACCSRALDSDARNILCDRAECRKKIEGVYLHCCICNEDDFDLCMDCMISTGKGCHDAEHWLKWAVRPVPHAEADAIAKAEEGDLAEFSMELPAQGVTVIPENDVANNHTNAKRRLESPAPPKPATRASLVPDRDPSQRRAVPSHQRVDTRTTSPATTLPSATPTSAHSAASPQARSQTTSPRPAVTPATSPQQPSQQQHQWQQVPDAQQQYDQPPPPYDSSRPPQRQPTAASPPPQTQAADDGLSTDAFNTLLQLNELRNIIAEAQSRQEAEEALATLQNLSALFQLVELQQAAEEAQRQRDAEEAQAALEGLAVLAQLGALQTAISGQGYHNSVQRAQEAEAARRYAMAKGQWTDLMDKVQYSQGYFSVCKRNIIDFSATAYCDCCLYPLGTTARWSCNPCGDPALGRFVLCNRCYTAGNRCLDQRHTMAFTPPDWAGQRCRRDANPIGQVYCSYQACRQRIVGAYMHCCSCDSDDFDLCWSCVFSKGVHCLPNGHLWRFSYMPVTQA